VPKASDGRYVADMLVWTNPLPFALDAENMWLGLRLLAGLFVIIRVVRARVTLSYALLWGPAVLFFPLITATVIFLFGGRKHSALAKAKQRIKAAARRLAGPVTSAGNSFRMLGDRHGHDTLEALHTEILAARHRIHISTYILAPDAVGREIRSLLVRRAREGVEVRVLVDAVGSWGTPLRLGRTLVKAGGQVARFNPVLPMQGKGSANWRNHRKIAVFDGQIAIIGGQNIGLAYMGREPSNRRFRDCSFRLAGPAAAALEQVFIADWCQATDADPATFAELLRNQPAPQGEVDVEVIASGPDCVNDPLWEKYVALIENARASITIVTPYFVPDKALFRLLVAAAAKGRRVRVLVPRRSDHRLLDFARRWYLRQLKEAGAEILFFKPDVLHAKLFIADDESLIIGSANLDMRSLFLNYEIAAVVRDPAALTAVQSFVASLEAESSPYSEDLYRRSRTWRGRMLEAISKTLAPLL
jgi:cardiolipin synthase